MDVNKRSSDLLNEQEKIFQDLLIKLFNKSLEGLNETLNEVNYLQRKHSTYDLYFYQIQNLKTNLISIQEQYDTYMTKISYQIKEQIQSNKQILFTEENLNELINQLLLKSIYSILGVFSSIESMISLFTGIGVLGIAPFRMTYVINNTASEMMFRDKLEKLNEKLTWIIQMIQIKKKQSLENIHFPMN